MVHTIHRGDYIEEVVALDMYDKGTGKLRKNKIVHSDNNKDCTMNGIILLYLSIFGVVVVSL